jgi:hypothetical protein
MVPSAFAQEQMDGAKTSSCRYSCLRGQPGNRFDEIHRELDSGLHCDIV